MVVALILLSVALAAAVALAGWLYLNGRRAQARVAALEARCRGMQQDSRELRNLHRICENRGEEIRRLRARLEHSEAELEALEQQTSQLNMDLFHESGMRILAQKEDGARRMKMDQLERELDESARKLKASNERARLSENQLREVIAQQEAEITRLRLAAARRAAKRPAASTSEALEQVTLDDILGG